MRKYYKILIVFNILLFAFMFPPLKAATGYNYSYDGRIIYSTVGMSVTNDGIFTVISDRWTNNKGVGVLSEEFKDPLDLFLFTEKDGTDVIYIVDGTSNILYVFDGNMNFREKFYQFEIRPEDFIGEEEKLSKTHTKGMTFGEYLQSLGLGLPEFMAIADIPYDERTEDQHFYITCFSLSGVYRAVTSPLNTTGEEDLIYLCDKKNNQVVILDATNYRVVDIVPSPDSISFSGKTFAPDKMIVDYNGRLYVISDGVYEGIMMFSSAGVFNSYKGVNYKTLSFWERFKRRFKTDEQLRLTQPNLNTTYTNLAIDKGQFIYATSRAGEDGRDTRMIQRLNREGKDVLTRNGYHDPMGDLIYIRAGGEANMRGPSRFSAVAVNDYGIYTIADAKTGRLFSYDDEGYLLYISGGNGNEFSDLNDPVAICYQGDNIIALDRGNKSVLRYVPTDIALVINKAVKYHYEGNLLASSEEWKNVIALNPNYEYAYVGIGKLLLNEERYKDAMGYLKIGHNVKYYSKAYKLHRDEVVKQFFTPVFIGGIVLIIAGMSYKTYRNIRYKPKDDDAGEGDE